MKTYKIKSSFKSLPVEIFWYPAERKTPHAVLFLKGLYGLHDPNSKNSWEMEFMRRCNKKYNFICINTARKGKDEIRRSVKEAFVGKTFRQECVDVQRAYRYLLHNEILLKSHILHVIANSFGGTVLLGVPELLFGAASVMFIGSGCGKSSTTTKPLLKTLFSEKKLLTPLRLYKGVFAFVRGVDDVVVPKESQNKIIQNALSVSARVIYDIQGLKHDLSPSLENVVVDRSFILVSVFEHLTSFL